MKFCIDVNFVCGIVGKVYRGGEEVLLDFFRPRILAGERGGRGYLEDLYRFLGRGGSGLVLANCCLYQHCTIIFLSISSFHDILHIFSDILFLRFNITNTGISQLKEPNYY